MTLAASTASLGALSWARQGGAPPSGAPEGTLGSCARACTRSPCPSRSCPCCARGRWRSRPCPPPQGHSCPGRPFG
eukprot:4120606-Alexandrium_andersonii.AAC.1